MNKHEMCKIYGKKVKFSMRERTEKLGGIPILTSVSHARSLFKSGRGINIRKDTHPAGNGCVFYL